VEISPVAIPCTRARMLPLHPGCHCQTLLRGVGRDELGLTHVSLQRRGGINLAFLVPYGWLLVRGDRLNHPWFYVSSTLSWSL